MCRDVRILLQVQTKLENPTRYHVMQKQKSQVRQYLNGNGLLTPLQGRNCVPPQSNSAPGIGGNYNAGVIPMEQMTNHSMSMYSTVPSPSPDAPAMSPALSSGATSTSEVSVLNSFVLAKNRCR